MKYIKKYNESDRLFDEISKNLDDIYPMLELYSKFLDMVNDEELMFDGSCSVRKIIDLSIKGIRVIYEISRILNVKMIGSEKDLDPNKGKLLFQIKYPKVLFKDIKKIVYEVNKYKNKFPFDVSDNHRRIIEKQKDRLTLLLADIKTGYSKIRGIETLKFSGLDIEERLLDFIDSGKVCYNNNPGIHISTLYDFEELRDGYLFLFEKNWNNISRIKGVASGYYKLNFVIKSIRVADVYSDILNRLTYNFKIISKRSDLITSMSGMELCEYLILMEDK